MYPEVWHLRCSSVKPSMLLSTAPLRCVGVNRWTATDHHGEWDTEVEEGGHGRKSDAVQRERHREQEHRVMWSSCQGINASLQLSSVTSAIKFPSNCSTLPKHLENAQLMSTDVLSHWHLIPLPAYQLIRQCGRVKTEREGQKKRKKKMKRRDGNIQQNEGNCTYQSQSWF